MIQAQLIREVNTINPASVTGAATSASVDTLGYHYAEGVVKLGAVGSAYTSLQVEESADGSTGWAAVTGLTASGSSGASRLPQTADANGTFKFYFPLVNRQRYLRIAANTGASASVLGAAFRLYYGDVTPQTVANRGNTVEFVVG